MKKINKYKVPISLFLSIIIIMTSSMIFSADAAKRIKSTKVSLNTSKATIAIGDIVDLNSRMTPINSTDSLKWYTSNKAVATVNNYGVVTGIKTGKATITVKTTSNKTAKCVVTVKKYLTESEILQLIKTKCLSEEKILELIKNNTLSEDKIKALITSNTLSKEDVEKLIADNTLSESTIKSMIASSSMSTSQVKSIVESYLKNNTTTNNNWADGTEIKLYEKQTLPYVVPCEFNSDDSQLTINKVTVKKYHYDNFYNGIFRRFKYVVDIEGKLPQSFSSSFIPFVGIQMISKNNSSENGHYYEIKNSDINYENGNIFSTQIELYDISLDADKFFISGFSYDYVSID